MQLFRNILTVAAFLPLLLASLVAFANLIGPFRATKGQGYSPIPFLSLLFCVLAFLCNPEFFGLWAFLPAVLDLGNLAMVLGVIHFAVHLIKGKVQ